MPQILEALPLDVAVPQLALYPRLHAAAYSALAAVHSGASMWSTEHDRRPLRTMVKARG